MQSVPQEKRRVERAGAARTPGEDRSERRPGVPQTIVTGDARSDSDAECTPDGACARNRDAARGSPLLVLVALYLTCDVELVALRVGHERPGVAVLLVISHPSGAELEEPGDLRLDVRRDDVQM